MKKQILSIAAIIAGFVTQAQQMDLPVTFNAQGIEYGVIGFGGAEASTIEADPTDASNTVVKVIKSATAELWAGTTISNPSGDGLANPIPFTESNSQMTLRVWSPDAGIPVRLKVEDHTNAGITVETEATTTVAAGWETLTFNFSNQAAGTAALNLVNAYDKASVFFNFGTTGAIAGEKTYYFDDLQMGQGGGTSNLQMDLPVTFNLSNVEYGVIGFGGAEASTIEADPTDASNTVVKVIKSATAELWAGTTISNPSGDGLANPIPFTESNSQMTLRVWSPDAGIPVRLKVEDHTNAGITVETEAITTVAAGWETLTFNFANQAAGTAALNLANAYDKASVFFNFGTTGAIAGEKTYYFDDLQMGQGGGTSNLQMDLPVTFNSTNVEYGVIGFGGAEASTIEADPTDASNTVVKVIKSATAELWAGTTISNPSGDGLANPIPFTESNSQMTLRVWSPDAGIPVRLKVEDHTNAGITVETEATTTVAAGWETLTFNFANQAAGTAALNLANAYDKASVFFNFGTTGAIAGEKTYYFDDLQMGQGGGPSTFPVVFRVDMSNVTAAYNTPEVNGTFNNWCGGCAPMADPDGDDVWELTIDLAPGTYEYKFAYDNWAGQENLSPGGACVITTGQFTNRLLNVSAAETLPLVCWESCSSCDNPSGPFNITFKVDMNEVTDNFTTPEVNGSFNNWCGGCAPMSDADGDNIWELTIPLAADTFEYKFAYDTWAGQETLTPGSLCTSTIDNFTNRSIIVTGEATLDPVCWGSCEPCVVGFVRNENFSRVELAPNPAADFLQFTLDQSTNELLQVRVLNAIGKCVLTNFLTGTKGSVDVSNLPDGFYFLNISSKTLNSTQSFIVAH